MRSTSIGEQRRSYLPSLLRDNFVVTFRQWRQVQHIKTKFRTKLKFGMLSPSFILAGSFFYALQTSGSLHEARQSCLGPWVFASRCDVCNKLAPVGSALGNTSVLASPWSITCFNCLWSNLTRVHANPSSAVTYHILLNCQCKVFVATVVNMQSFYDRPSSTLADTFFGCVIVRQSVWRGRYQLCHCLSQLLLIPNLLSLKTS